MSNTFGLYRATVVSTADPMGARRMQVSMPGVLGPGAAWASLCAPFAGPAGAPPVGSTVWVMFEAGDPRRPVVMGTIPAGGR